MKISDFLLCLLFVNLTFSCKSQTKQIDVSDETGFEQNLFSSDSLLMHVKSLSSDKFEGRRTGTEGSSRARNYIINNFKKLGIAPFGNSFEHPFAFASRGNKYNATNVLGLINGTDFPNKFIVISGHYDHEGIKRGNIYNGADDNASSVSALMAFAEYFQKHPPKHSVILAAFDGEELGLKGAYHFVDQAIKEDLNIVFNINMDMISRNDNNELYVTGLNYYKFLKPIIESISFPQDFYLLSGHDSFDDKRNWTYSSDHAPFHKNEIPFLYFGVEDHEDYHRPSDDFEKIHPEFYIKSVYSIVSIVKAIDTLSL